MAERFRVSMRGWLLVVAVVGFDLAAIARAIQQGWAAHALFEYVVGFGLVLLLLNLALIGLGWSFTRPGGDRWLATPSPAMIAGLYVAVMAVAILSVLFLSGRF